MTSGQYQIPQSQEVSAEAFVREEVDSAFVGVESGEQLGEYAYEKMIEAEIESLHAAATEDNLPKTSVLDQLRETVRAALSR